jgi:fibronectin-binding autotransporter adhesin
MSVATGGQFDTATNLPNTLTVTGADSHIPSGTTLSNLLISSGAKLTGPAALSLLGDWTNNGSFAANGGKVTFDGAGAQQIAGSSTTTFQDLTINKSSGTLSSLTSLNVLGQTDVQKGGFSPASGSALTNLLIESLGTLNAPTGDLAVSGNWSNNGSFNPGSSGSVTFNGGAAQQIGGSAANSFHNLIVNKASGTLNTSTAVTVVNLLDVKKGTFNPASGSDFADVKIETGATLTAPTGNLTVSGGWDNQGSFTPGTGSVTFDGSSTQAISGTANFNALVLDNPTNVTSVQPLSVAQAFTLAQGAFNPPSNSQFHTLNITSGSTFSLDAADTLNVSGDFNNNGSFSPAAGSTTVFNGTMNQTISGAATNFSNLVINNNGANVTGNVPVHVSGTTTITKGTFDPADASTFDALSIGTLGALTSTSGETITIAHDLVNNGTFTSTGGTLNLGGSFYNQGSYSTNGGTTNITGSLLNSGSYVAALGDLNLGGNLSNTGTFNPGGGTVTFDGTTPQTISGSGISFASLVLNNPAGVSADSAITVKNTLEIAKGSFNPPTGSQFHDLLIDGAGTLTLDSTDRVMVSGDFTNNGAFKPASGSTVVMDGSTAQVIGGSSLVNFKNLEINNTATAPLGVTSSRDILVSGTTTLVDGIFAPADGTMLNIVNIQPNGVFEVHSPSAITITNSLTNNGTFNQDGGSIDLWGSFINKRVFSPTGGTLDISGDFTNTAGSTFAPQSGTVNVTGDFNNAGVFAPQGGLLSLLSNFSNTGSMAPQGGTVEMVGTKAQQITGNPATFANLVFNNTFGVSAASALTVKDVFNLAQGSFNPPSGSQFNDLTVALGAALNLDPTDRLSISGDIQNNGTINPNSGTMVLDGSTAQAILGNAFTFGNLEINNSGSAPITSAFPLVVSGLLNLKDGTLDLPTGSDLNDVTVASGANLDGSAGNITVSGDWNNLGNFTPGSNTVTFDGTGPQQILGSTDFNDLIVGATSTLQMGANANLGLFGSLDIISGGAFDSISYEPNTLTIFGAGPHDLPNGLQLDNLVVANGATFVPPASLLVAGDFTNNGTFTPNDGTINLDGTGPQTIGGTSPTSFDNLVIDNSSPSAAVQSTGPVNITGGLDIQDGAFAPAAGSNLNDVTIASGASLDGPTGNLGVSGDWINNGTFVPEPGSTVIFAGSLPQIIGGTIPTVFDTLVIDNASGQPVTTSTPVTVTGPTDIIGGSLEPQPGSTFGDVTIEPGSTLIIPPAGGLTIEGTLTNNNPSNVLRTLSLTPGGDGSGTITTTPSGNTFNDGQVVAVTAIPSRGSSFGSWTGGLSGTTNPQSLTMNSSHSATAVFTLNSYQLTILTGGNGLGTVTSDLIGPSYKFGTVVSLTPHAGKRSIFSGWSGAASGSTNPLSLKIEDNTTLTANFSLSTVLLSGNTGIGGVTLTITDSAAAQSTLGGNMTVVSDADGNFAFEVPYNWSGRVTLSKTKYTFDPAYMDFTNVQTDQKTQQIIAHEIFYSYMPLIQNLNKEMIVYQQDFSSNVGAEWSSTSTSTSPTGQKFLGEFGNKQVQLHLSNLPAHNVVTVSFDLYLLRSWDGNSTNQGPDVWLFNADNKTLLNTTFSNNLANQSYPGATSIGNYPLQTGAAKVNSLGYYFLTAPMDSIYHLSYTLDHTDAAVLLAFQASGLQNMNDESWGLDNIVITTQLK